MSLSFNIGDILSKEDTDRNDYFRILGCSENSTEEQIATEYKIRALKCHPDKNPKNGDAIREFQRLQEARDVLTDPEMRQKYDKWRHCEMSIPFKTWLSMHDRCATTMHWAKPRSQTMLEAGSSPSAKDNSTGDVGGGHYSTQSQTSLPTITRTVPKGWESESAPAGVYQQFRNYKI